MILILIIEVDKELNSCVGPKPAILSLFLGHGPLPLDLSSWAKACRSISILGPWPTAIGSLFLGHGPLPLDLCSWAKACHSISILGPRPTTIGSLFLGQSLPFYLYSWASAHTIGSLFLGHGPHSFSPSSNHTTHLIFFNSTS